MTTYNHKDGDFEMTVITHGKPDPHIAAQAILPLVMAALEKDENLKLDERNSPEEKPVKS